MQAKIGSLVSMQQTKQSQDIAFFEGEPITFISPLSFGGCSEVQGEGE